MHVSSDQPTRPLVRPTGNASEVRTRAATSPSTVVGHVYVNDNNAGGENSIGAFDRRGDGTLTPMPGSPFAAGGLGSPATTLSQGALQLSSEGRYILAVARGSSEISVLRIERDGSLEPVGDGPVSSNPVSSGNTISGFAVDGGIVTELPGSPTPGPTAAQPIGIVVT
jgi:hypothetical protein